MLDSPLWEDEFVSGWNLFSGSETRDLGMHHDQKFFATRHVSGRDLEIPFESGHFNALIEISGRTDETVLRGVAWKLLEHGMRSAVCHGEDSELLGDIINELVDEHGFAHEGRTVYSSVHDDESLAEVIDYFVLPNDLAQTSLLVIIGGESDFETAVDCFTTVTEGARELVLAEA